MIVRDYLPMARIWPRVSKQIVMLFLLGVAVTALYEHADWSEVSVPSLPLAMMGGALSIFLAFRNNSAYDRWWEARQAWGALVNTARTFSRQVLTIVDDVDHGAHNNESVDPQRARLIELQIAYVHALRCHLRGQNPFAELSHTLPVELVAWLRTQRNVPLGILLEMGKLVQSLFNDGRMDSIRLTSFDRTLTDLCNVQGVCERIKNTPLPRQYEYFPRVLVAIYCVMLPFGMVEGLQTITPAVSTLVSLIFLSLESIGKDIEDPFENTVHDTPMSALSRTIEINLRQNLGQTRLPPDVGPVEGFVY